MMQIWVLTLAYFIFTCLMLFLDDYRLALSFLLSVKHHLIVTKQLRLFLFAAGLVLATGNLFFPIYPGPVLLGDLFSAILCVFIAIYYLRYAKTDRKVYLKLSDRTCAILLSVFTLIHFICPSLVLF